MVFDKLLALGSAVGSKRKNGENPRSPPSKTSEQSGKVSKRKDMAVGMALGGILTVFALLSAAFVAEIFKARERAKARRRRRQGTKPPINDLPNDVLVSIFEAVGDERWVRHTVPRVCKEWNEIYRSKDASPLHETLEVDFDEEVFGAWRGRPLRRFPAVHASRVISWAARRAGSVRRLRFKGFYSFIPELRCRDALEDFSAEDLVTIVAIAGPSLTEISIHSPKPQSSLGELCKRPFWQSLRTSVVPAGRLRSLVVQGIESAVSEFDVEPLGQLAGSLEVLELWAYINLSAGLQRFPESLCALTELRILALLVHSQITAIPAEISSLKKLEELDLRYCNLSSLPKELGELPGLTTLNVGDNQNLGNLPQDEAFPAELEKMKPLRRLGLGSCGLRTVPAFVRELKSLEFLWLIDNDISSLPKELGELSRLTKLNLEGNENLGITLSAAEAFPAELGTMKFLRELSLRSCGLRTVPAFVGDLESLERLELSGNEDLQIDAPLDFLIEGYPRLRAVWIRKWREAPPWTPESLAHLEAFEARLRAKNPNAYVSYK